MYRLSLSLIAVLMIFLEFILKSTYFLLLLLFGLVSFEVGYHTIVHASQELVGQASLKSTAIL